MCNTESGIKQQYQIESSLSLPLNEAETFVKTQSNVRLALQPCISLVYGHLYMSVYVCIHERGPTFRLGERRGRLLFLLLRFSIFFGLSRRVPQGPCRGLSDRFVAHWPWHKSRYVVNLWRCGFQTQPEVDGSAMSLPVVIVCYGAIFEIARRTTAAGSTTDKTDWSVGHRVSCSPIVVDSTRISRICMYVCTYWLCSCLLEMQYASASARTGRASGEIFGDLEMLSRVWSTRNRKRRRYGLSSHFFSWKCISVFIKLHCNEYCASKQIAVGQESCVLKLWIYSNVQK